jgi:hypothetical protein
VPACEYRARHATDAEILRRTRCRILNVCRIHRREHHVREGVEVYFARPSQRRLELQRHRVDQPASLPPAAFVMVPESE